MDEWKSVILGCSGGVLTADEKAFFSDSVPWGFFLFRRNLREPHQIEDLISSLRESVGRSSAPIFIDQEGGSVQRLKPPLAPNYPSAADVGALYLSNPEVGLRAAFILGRLYAFDLLRYNISANAMPVLDVPLSGHDGTLGTRTYGHDPDVVTILGRESSEGLLAGGVLPVMKHFPGHGRAQIDSHLSLPCVSASLEDLCAWDFLPFRSLKNLSMGLVAHILYSAIDPDAPATFSRVVVQDVIRHVIGFDGFLMSDDISMHALSGSLKDRASRVLDSGIDAVLCASDSPKNVNSSDETLKNIDSFFQSMRDVVSSIPLMTGKSRKRAQDALENIPEPDDCDEACLREELCCCFQMRF